MKLSALRELSRSLTLIGFAARYKHLVRMYQLEELKREYSRKIRQDTQTAIIAQRQRSPEKNTQQHSTLDQNDARESQYDQDENKHRYYRFLKFAISIEKSIRCAYNTKIRMGFDFIHYTAINRARKDLISQLADDGGIDEGYEQAVSVRYENASSPYVNRPKKIKKKIKKKLPYDDGFDNRGDSRSLSSNYHQNCYQPVNTDSYNVPRRVAPRTPLKIHNKSTTMAESQLSHNKPRTTTRSQQGRPLDNPENYKLVTMVVRPNERTPRNLKSSKVNAPNKSSNMQAMYPVDSMMAPARGGDSFYQGAYPTSSNNMNLRLDKVMNPKYNSKALNRPRGVQPRIIGSKSKSNSKVKKRPSDDDSTYLAKSRTSNRNGIFFLEVI
jgi:hypothetical protein